MGEFTEHFRLYKPDIGERGWGELVNENFEILDKIAHTMMDDILRLAIRSLMNSAMANATTKDFYAVLSDVVTSKYPNGYLNTLNPVYDKRIYVITITNTTRFKAYNYQIKITITDPDFFSVCTDPKYIELYDSKTMNPVPFYVEKFDAENKVCIIWVKFTLSPKEVKTLILKVNTNRTVSLSNPNDIFLFFEDFNEANYTVVKGDSSKVSVANSWIDIDGSNGEVIVECSKKINLTIGWILEAKILLVNPSNSIELMAINDKNSGYAGEFYYNGKYGCLDAVVNYKTVRLATGIRHTVYPAGSINLVKFGYSYPYLYLYDINSDKIIGQANYINKWYPLHKVSIRVANGSRYKVDWIRARTMPFIKITTNVSKKVVGLETKDFISDVGFNKILVTVDSDCKIQYSTDSGLTWNDIEPDVETEIGNADKVRLRFTDYTYFRGYAMVVW